MTKKRVVVVGGGFGGVRVALDLFGLRHDLEVTLIDKNGYHSYPSDYYKLVSSKAEKQHVDPVKFRLLFSSVTIPLAEIFEGKRNVELLFDEVTEIEPERKQVICASGKKIRYDWLILALGSVTSFYDIPGLRERAYEFKTTADALNVRAALDEVFLRKAKHETTTVVIGGGGLTGCEIAAELMPYLMHIAHTHSHPTKNISLLIVEAAGTLLRTADSWIQKRVEKRLRGLGVKIIFSSPVIDVNDETINLKSGETLPYDVFIWTAGVQANSLVEKISGIELGKANCIVVDDYLRVNVNSSIFAIGDVAYFAGFSSTGGSTSGEDEKPLSMTAQTAVSQGQYVAYTIKRLLYKRRIFKYHPRISKFIIPLGGCYAIADLGWFKLEGFSAWTLKRLVALKYFLSILSVRKALKLWWKGV